MKKKVFVRRIKEEEKKKKNEDEMPTNKKTIPILWVSQFNIHWNGEGVRTIHF